MSSRAPLPLRWLQRPPTVRPEAHAPPSGNVAANAGEASRILSVYKPSGLPYFSASQLAAAGNDGRQLFRIQSIPRGGSTTASSHTHQPTRDDTSDSLYARLCDTLPIAATPYLALPLPSSLLLQHPRGRRTRTTGSAEQRHQRNETNGNLSPSLVNSWTTRHKGTTLVSLAQGDAIFLRNASRMGFVSQTFHVLVRLPHGVVENARRHAKSVTSSPSQSAGSVPLLNPYVREMVEAYPGYSTGIHTEGNSQTEEAVGLRITSVVDGRLPSSLRHEPLLEGSLVDWPTGRLRFNGRLSGFLRPNLPLPRDMEKTASTRRRLTNLFIPCHGATSDHACTKDNAMSHPWIGDAHRLVVSVDPAASAGRRRRQGRGAGSASTVGFHTRDGDAIHGAAGKAVSVSYRLLAIGSHSGSDVGLYQVTGADVTPEEVAALFAAEGFFPWNDFTHNLALANTVSKAAEEVRRSMSHSLLSGLPMATKHALLASTPEELVALPLLRQPLRAADGWALGQLYQEAVQYANLGLGMLASGVADETLERMKRAVSSGAQGSVDGLQRNGVSPPFFPSTDTLGHLLMDVLRHSTALDEAEVTALLQLCMGSGVECVGMSYPNPADVQTALAMQHAMARFEDGRLDEESRARLALSMEMLQTGTVGATGSDNIPSRAVASVPDLAARYGTTSVPRGWGSTGAMRSHATARTWAMADDVAFTFATALTSATEPLPAGDAASRAKLSKPKDVTQKGFANPSGALQDPMTVVDLTEVPASYGEFVTAWKDAVKGSEVDGPAVLSREGLHALYAATVAQKTSTETEEDATHLSAEGATDEAPHEAPSLAQIQQQQQPLFVRIEELGQYHCSSCGSEGHPWTCCPYMNLHDLSALPAFSATEETRALLSSTYDKAAQSQTPAQSPVQGDDVSMTATGNADGVMAYSEEVPTTAQDAAVLLEAQDRRQTELAALSRGSAGESLIAVPSRAPTADVDVRAMRERGERAKPAMHRRTVRCAYCHGKHHISACPKLSGAAFAEDDAVASATAELMDAVNPSAASYPHHSGDERGAVMIDRERVRQSPERLFCIRCGAHGHLYTHCPSTPENLHPATHCTICMQSFRRIHHNPVQCPRRRSVPSTAEYFANGIPRDYVVDASEGSASGSFRRASMERRRQDALRRRKRGAMLIADSFVDKQ